MKAFAVLSVVVLSAVLVAAQGESCQNKLLDVCEAKEWKESEKCTAKYSGALLDDETSVLRKLQEFTFNQLRQSFEFMLRATYFGNYKASRPGFSKLFRGMSDAAWNDAISVTKLVAERGGESVFSKQQTVDWKDWAVNSATIGLGELPSLGRALDSVKKLATEANGIHHRATHHLDTDKPVEIANHQHDAHIAHFIQEEFSGRYASEIRSLAGHSTDLRQLLLGKDCVPTPSKKCVSGREKSLSLFLFDEYLLKL